MKLNKTFKISFLDSNLLPGISGGKLVVGDVTQPALPCSLSLPDFCYVTSGHSRGPSVVGRWKDCGGPSRKDLVHRKFLR